MSEDGKTETRQSCTPGKYIEFTDLHKCTDCGACITSCKFNARKLTDNLLMTSQEACMGCSSCSYACPSSAIYMVPRKLAVAT